MTPRETVLAQVNHQEMEHFYLKAVPKQVARLIAFGQREEFVYWAGDATDAYPKRPEDYRYWWGQLGEVYQRKDCSHLRRFIRHVLFVKGRYFIVFDELETDPERPATFQWLYHVYPDVPLNFDEERFTFSYQIDGVSVKVAHLCNPKELTFEDRRRREGLVNPITGENYIETANERIPSPEHTIWIGTREPAHRWGFLSVIFPYRSSDPEPQIVRLDDLTARVSQGPEQEETISFDRNTEHRAGVVVDYGKIR